MKVAFMSKGWEDYLYWQATDKQVIKKLNSLIKDCQRSPFEGIGQPEALKHEFSGWWSRRITDEHRLVYRLVEDRLEIAQCRHHY
ncbi:Txe/YoeB family addiction module toxin [Devosia sp. 63-57]|nr:Txe/YoeB family addiction module toxin [Devosia sp. 63-57]ODT48965.1 MAG: toxin YoeB [Pelagibacterium sp. SCN 63-126]ODU89358.1 MAG: toxin YoeB [Pelagibacterium sp. SCN 63-17]OJX44105.1 MAG: toxin YoeB [Devosia sp. 63-57]